MRFQIELDTYRGPLDLLLYLVRKQEVEVTEIPIAEITDQFLEYVNVLEKIDVDSAGEFLDMASTLIEIKSRMLLPQEDEVQQEMEDPRQDLVRRLLEFKQYRDAASMLEERGRQWRERYPRSAADVPQERFSPLDQPIHGVELWDLVSALGRVMRERLDRAAQTTCLRYDETPVHIYVEQIYARLERERHVEFNSLFPDQTHRSTFVGMFLAVLELVRHGHAVASQIEPFGEVVLELGPEPLRAAT